MKNLIIRALTGAVYVALLVGCTCFSSVTAAILFSLVAAATVWEFCTNVNEHYGAVTNRLICAWTAFFMVMASWSMMSHIPNANAIAALFVLNIIYLLVSELYRQEADPLKNWSLMFAAQIYIAAPFALTAVLGFPQGTYSWLYILGTFVFLWLNDTGAYLVGCSLHNVFPAKLFERVSPKKSWVGSIGGALFCIAAAIGASFYFTEISMLKWIGFALVVVVSGTWGDLVESLFKRQLGVKDSGNILPGHGGLLDRFDSALLAIPAVVVYFCFVY